jgi:anti-sigma-K factor RskA
LTCSGFSAELYDLFVLGTLEIPESSELAGHIAQDCTTCIPRLKRSLEFWSLFGAAFAGEAGEPGRRLVMSAPNVIEMPRSGAIGKKSHWREWGAAAAAVAVVTAVGTWYFAVSRLPAPSSPTTTTQNEIAALQSRIQSLSQERDQLARQRDDARAQAVPPPSTLPAGQQASDRALAAVQIALAAIRTQLDQSEKARQDAQTRATSLEAQLNAQQQRLTVALDEQRQAQERFSRASDLQRRSEEQVQTLTTQVQRLTRERAELLETIQRQTQQSSQSLRLITLLNAPGTKLIQVAGTEAAPQARGYALLTADRHLIFYETGLPDLPTGRDYQLWLIRGKSPAIVSGGVFQGGQGRAGQVEFTNANLATDIKGIAVTDEPAGGSAKPTGHKVLVGTARS